jgi:hypothetical protein
VCAVSRTYEALKDVSKQDYVLKLCEEGAVIEFAMLHFFKGFFQGLGEDFVSDNGAEEGLTRLHGKHTPPAVGYLSLRNKADLFSFPGTAPTFHDSKIPHHPLLRPLVPMELSIRSISFTSSTTVQMNWQLCVL